MSISPSIAADLVIAEQAAAAEDPGNATCLQKTGAQYNTLYNVRRDASGAGLGLTAAPSQGFAATSQVSVDTASHHGRAEQTFQLQSQLCYPV